MFFFYYSDHNSWEPSANLGDCRDAIADFKMKNNPKPVKTKRKRDGSSKEIVQKKRKVTKESENSDQTPIISDSKSKRFDSNSKESASVQNDFAPSLKEKSIKQAKPNLIKLQNTLKKFFVKEMKNAETWAEIPSGLKHAIFEPKENTVYEEIVLKEMLVQQDTISLDQGITEVTSKLENTNSTSEADVQKFLKSVLKPKSIATTEGWF